MKQLTITYNLRKGNFYSLHFYLNQKDDYGQEQFNDKGKLLISKKELKQIIIAKEEYNCKPIDLQIYDVTL